MVGLGLLAMVCTQQSALAKGPADGLRVIHSSGSYDATEMGPAQDLVALPDGYGATFTSPVAGKLAVTFTRVR